MFEEPHKRLYFVLAVVTTIAVIPFFLYPLLSSYISFTTYFIAFCAVELICSVIIASEIMEYVNNDKVQERRESEWKYHVDDF